MLLSQQWFSYVESPNVMSADCPVSGAPPFLTSLAWSRVPLSLHAIYVSLKTAKAHLPAQPILFFFFIIKLFPSKDRVYPAARSGGLSLVNLFCVPDVNSPSISSGSQGLSAGEDLLSPPSNLFARAPRAQSWRECQPLDFLVFRSKTVVRTCPSIP